MKVAEKPFRWLSFSYNIVVTFPSVDDNFDTVGVTGSNPVSRTIQVLDSKGLTTADARPQTTSEGPVFSRLPASDINTDAPTANAVLGFSVRLRRTRSVAG